MRFGDHENFFFLDLFSFRFESHFRSSRGSTRILSPASGNFHSISVDTFWTPVASMAKATEPTFVQCIVRIELETLNLKPQIVLLRLPLPPFSTWSLRDASQAAQVQHPQYTYAFVRAKLVGLHQQKVQFILITMPATRPYELQSKLLPS